MMGNGMMDGAWGLGGMAVIGPLVIVLLVLAIAALIKYLMR